MWRTIPHLIGYFWATFICTGRCKLWKLTSLFTRHIGLQIVDHKFKVHSDMCVVIVCVCVAIWKVYFDLIMYCYFPTVLAPAPSFQPDDFTVTAVVRFFSAKSSKNMQGTSVKCGTVFLWWRCLGENPYQPWTTMVLTTTCNPLPCYHCCIAVGFSDPYCKFKLGTQKYRSKVIWY